MSFRSCRLLICLASAIALSSAAPKLLNTRLQDLEKDVNNSTECMYPNQNFCDVNAICSDRQGSTDGFSCQCKPGFLDLSPDPISQPGLVCVSITNECLDPALNDCHPHARCIDTSDSYECVCQPGYEDLKPSYPGRECVAVATKSSDASNHDQDTPSHPAPFFTRNILQNSINSTFFQGASRSNDIIDAILEAQLSFLESGALGKPIPVNEICKLATKTLEDKYGCCWSCFMMNDLNSYVTYTDSFIKFRFDDERNLVVFRSLGVSYKLYTQYEVQNSIWDEYTNIIDPKIQSQGSEWLSESLILYTDRNGKSRRNVDICSYMATKFNDEFGGGWYCVYSDKNIAKSYDMTKQHYMQIWWYKEDYEGGEQYDVVLFKKMNILHHYTLEEIQNGTSSALSPEREANATLIFQEAINETLGNQTQLIINRSKLNEICEKTVQEFNQNLGGEWMCFSTVTDEDLVRVYAPKVTDRMIFFHIDSGFFLAFVDILIF